MRAKFSMPAVGVAMVICAMGFAMGRASEPKDANADAKIVACRALEAHASAAPAVTAVLFHQQNKEDQARFAVLLRQNSGAGIEIQVSGGNWDKATVFRLKSCFGRGLLLLPASEAAPKDSETFLVKFP